MSFAAKCRNASGLSHACDTLSVNSWLHRSVTCKNLVAGQMEEFRRQLHQMWFSFYSRSNVRDDTCGFEHGDHLIPLTHHCTPCMQSALLTGGVTAWRSLCGRGG